MVVLHVLAYYQPNVHTNTNLFLKHTFLHLLRIVSRCCLLISLGSENQLLVT